jgi:hypothetical protein
MHSSEAFYALDDSLEAAVFSVLVEMLKVVMRKGYRLGEKRIGQNCSGQPDGL